MAISAAKRKALPKTEFALPAQRKYPLDTAGRVRNAAARLEQNKGDLSESEYSEAKSRIARAAKRFGIKSEYNKPSKRLHVRADLAEGGSLHVRHMSDSACGTITAADAGDGSAPVWIQLAKPGSFRGHPAGPFVLDGKTFQQIVDNFRATENHRVPIDFEHASEADPTEGSIPVNGAPAQGWIVDMSIREGELWGLVEWGSLARDYIKSGQYKFFSPAIRFNSKDRVTGAPIGARMTSGALTNNPFLDGMQPLAAKDVDTIAAADRLAHKPHEYMPAIKRALSLHELASAKETAEHLDKLRDHFDAVGQDPDAMHEGIKLGDYAMSLRSLTGAAPGATWDEVFDAVEDLIQAAMKEHELEYHGGEMPADDDDAEMDDVSSDGDTTMSDQEKAELVTLREEVSTLKVKLTSAEAEVAKEKSRADAATSELATLRDKADSDELDAVIARCSDRGYSAALKPDLLVMLRANPDSFRKLHPAPEAKPHLFKEATPPEKKEDAAAAIADLNGESYGQTINRLMSPRDKGGQGMSYAQAQLHASAIHGRH